MKRIEHDQYEFIDGGGLLATIAAATTIAQGLSTVLKILDSDSGSFNNKTGNVTWKNANEEHDNALIIPKVFNA